MGFALAGVAILYAAVLFSQDTSVFWSPDEGGKYLQMRVLEQAHGGKPPSLLYGGLQFDPGFEFYPPGTVYPRVESAGRIRFGWSKAFSVLALPFYRWWGIPGLYAWPVLGVLLSCWCLLKLTPGTFSVKLLSVGLAALASPLFFYGVLFWEHTTAVAFVLSGYLFLRTAFEAVCPFRKVASFVGAMILFGLALALRAEIALAVAAVGIGFLPKIWAKGGQSARIILGLVLLLVPWMGWTMYRWMPGGLLHGPDYRNLDGVVRATLGELTLDQFWATAKQVLFNTSGEFGVPLSPVVLALAVSGWMGIAVSVFVRGWLRLFLFILGVCFTMPLTYAMVFHPDRYRALHSLLAPAPWFAFSFWLFRSGQGDQSRGTPLGVVISFCLIVPVVFALVGTTHGGPEWGLRYALFFYPMAALTAAAGWAQAWQDYRLLWMRFVLLAALCATVGGGLGLSVRGLREIRQTKRELSEFQGTLQRLNQPVVTDLWWVPAAMPTCFEASELYVLGQPTGLTRWYDVRGGQVPAFIIMSYSPDLAAAAARPGWRVRLSTVAHGMHFWMVERL